LLGIDPTFVRRRRRARAIALLAIASSVLSFAAADPAVAAKKAPKLTLTSPAFANGAEIPDGFTCSGASASPTLKWKNVPRKTVQLALIVQETQLHQCGADGRPIAFSGMADREELAVIAVANRKTGFVPAAWTPADVILAGVAKIERAGDASAITAHRRLADRRYQRGIASGSLWARL